MKKLMILGGSRYALPVIKAAHELRRVRHNRGLSAGQYRAQVFR